MKGCKPWRLSLEFFSHPPSQPLFFPTPRPNSHPPSQPLTLPDATRLSLTAPCGKKGKARVGPVARGARAQAVAVLSWRRLTPAPAALL